jgi:hypothetical protein
MNKAIGLTVGILFVIAIIFSDSNHKDAPSDIVALTELEKEANNYALSLIRNTVKVCNPESSDVLAIINKVFLLSPPNPEAMKIMEELVGYEIDLSPENLKQPESDLLGLKILKPDSTTTEELKLLKDGNELVVLDKIYKLDDVDRLNGFEFRGIAEIRLNNVAVKTCDTCDWRSGKVEESTYNIIKRNGEWDYQSSEYAWSTIIPMDCPT